MRDHAHTHTVNLTASGVASIWCTRR